LRERELELGERESEDSRWINFDWSASCPSLILHGMRRCGAACVLSVQRKLTLVHLDEMLSQLNGMQSESHCRIDEEGFAAS